MDGVRLGGPDPPFSGILTGGIFAAAPLSDTLKLFYGHFTSTLTLH